jgi:hypothetical protein
MASPFDRRGFLTSQKWINSFINIRIEEVGRAFPLEDRFSVIPTYNPHLGAGLERGAADMRGYHQIRKPF